MFQRTRHQQGTIARVKRKQGPDCWIFRWRETDINGKRVRRKAVLSTVKEYPTESSALKAAESLRITINGEQPQPSQQPVSVRALVDHFKQQELSLVQGAEDEEEGRAYSTRSTYIDILDFHVAPKWGDNKLHEVRTVAVVVTGLRRSELIGLKWLDVDFEQLELSVTRSVYRQRVGRCKTEISRKPVPLDPWVAEELLTWKRATPYNQPEDWVFASTRKKGKQPYSPDSILKRCIQPAATRAKIAKHIGWHTFRRTFSTLLKANGEDIKVVQELLRHATVKMTLAVYAQAVTPDKRKAQSKVAELLQAGVAK